MGDRLGVYIDMPGSDLAALIDKLDNREKRQLIESLEDAIETMQMIAVSVKQRMPKVMRRAS